MLCIACSGNDWKSLPVPVPGRSISTAGIAFDEPLEREQCMACGLLQKKSRDFVGHGRFYEERYQSYYERPASQTFDRSRYVAMAEWMASSLTADFRPASILDVGCGAGWAMQVTKDVYPEARFVGVEPSAVNAQRARSAGFEVIEKRLGEVSRDRTYDLIYSINVLQHVIDPRAFLTDLASLLSDRGRIVLVLPDASEPSHELLWCDHNFSFRPRDVAGLAAHASLRVHAWSANPQHNSLLNKQMVILARADGTEDACPAPSLSAEALFQQRSSYMAAWQGLDDELQRRGRGHARTFNFGASMWTWLMAGYCPGYWESVSACLVDGGSGECCGKAVTSPDGVEFTQDDCIVLGINPVVHPTAKARFDRIARTVVTWSDLILK